MKERHSERQGLDVVEEAMQMRAGWQTEALARQAAAAIARC